MKTILVFALLFLLVTTEAQVSNRMRIDENTIVKDSSGQVYSYNTWQLLIKSKQFGFKPINPRDASEGVYIYRLSESEKHRRDSLAEIYASKAPAPPESKFFKTGRQITSFKEKDMDGNKFSLKEMTGKVIVLNFWFVGCPPCREEIPELNKIVEKYKDNPDVVFIAIALDDINSIRDFLKTHPYNYHIIDNGRYIAQGTYGISSYPTNVVVDKKGIIRFHTSGLSFNTVHHLKKTIDELVNEKL